MGKLFDANETKAKERLPILEEHLRSILSILKPLDEIDIENISSIQEVCLLFLGRMKRHALDCITIQNSRSIDLIVRSALEGQMLFEWIYGKAEGRDERARRYLNLRVIEFAKARSLPVLQNREKPLEWDQIIFEELSKVSEDELPANEFNELMTPGGKVNHSKRFAAYLMEVGTVAAIFKAAGAELVYETEYAIHSMFQHWNPVTMPQLRPSIPLEEQFSSAIFTQATALWDFARMLHSIGLATTYAFGQKLTGQLLLREMKLFEAKTEEWGAWP